MSSTVPARKIPADLAVRLDQLCAKLQRLSEGVLSPNLIPELSVAASILQPQLASAGCDRQAAFLRGSINHLTAATAAWASIRTRASTATTLEFEDSVFQALDEACWALTWEDWSGQTELPASATATPLQGAA